MRIKAVLSLCVLAGCATTVARVKVPTDPSQDAPPRIKLTAVALVPDGPGAAGDIEPGKAEVSATTSVQVSRGSRLMLVANAVNPGGVQSFSLAIAQRGATILQAHATESKASDGTALNTLTLRAPDGTPGGTLTVTVDEPVVVSLTATNFNAQSSSITVTYQPADLTVTLAADPPIIGYQAAGQSTLRWSVLYGVPPIEITGNVAPGPLPASGSATVAPSSTTTYQVRAKDRVTSRFASAVVTVRQPPSPPSPKLSASPNDGYNCLGVEDTLTWIVDHCGSGCTVTLSGKGFGYASNYNVTLNNLPRTGSFKVTPADQINFTLTASSPFGTKTATKNLTIAPPNVCPGGGQMPSLSVFYFAIKASDPAQVQCTWTAVLFDTEAHAKAQLEATYGPSYTVTAITADDYHHQRRCP